MDIPANHANDYETAYALTALSEFYLANIKYKRREVLNAIKLASKYLTSRDWKLTNNNIRGLGAWSLSNAYKATHQCRYLLKAKEICEIMMADVTKTPGDLNGTWQTGGLDSLEEYGNVYHDTKMFYHVMILRGLIETFDAIPDKDTLFKANLVETIKIGVNHVIEHRLYSTEPGSFLLKYAHKATNDTIVPWSEYGDLELEKYIEAFSKLAYYASQSDFFNSDERQNLKDLLNKISLGISENNKWHITAFGYYSYYIKATNEKIDVFNWNANTYYKCVER